MAARAEAPIEDVRVSAYTVPTEMPESDHAPGSVAEDRAPNTSAPADLVQRQVHGDSAARGRHHRDAATMCPIGWRRAARAHGRGRPTPADLDPHWHKDPRCQRLPRSEPEVTGR